MTFHPFVIRLPCYGFKLLKYRLAALISGAQQALAIIGVLEYYLRYELLIVSTLTLTMVAPGVLSFGLRNCKQVALIFLYF